AVALNFTQGRLGDFALLRQLSLGVAGVSVASSALIAWLVGSQLVGWVGAHTAATERVTEGDYGVRIAGRRPDELGRLTDRFNDMCAALERAQVEREVFGEVVGPDARDEMLDSRGLGGEVREVTVLFADIRGFTHRSAGEAPEQAVDLLNRFLTHAVAAVQGQNGHVNKFLGDGILALFGAPRKQADHADRAVRAALELLTRLERLNQELVAGSQLPLRVGIGIHTGPALVGSIGAALSGSDGKKRFRREYTAIGETVNLGQRLEQLTKTCGGPVLLSEQTRDRLNGGLPLTCLGPQRFPGYEGTLVVYRVEAQGAAPTGD
ncbi:MAG TPA: adenylate/guanylate cyclase domain-containing protein, partial [Gemmataceae bacterium]|nr:adenylate/guanylate cyclase domain-containing protein [Gemmataceae bacterium]